MAETYRDLVVWNKALQLAECTYAFVLRLPEFERFGLSAQLRRAAISIPSNIAEGHERRSRAEYRRFISIACGSGVLGGLTDETGRLLRAIERSLRQNVAEDSTHYDGCRPSALSPQRS